jgi:hypothetical protein
MWLLEQNPLPFPSFGIPYPAFVSTAGLVAITAGLVVITHYFDPTKGLVTLSMVIVVAFVAATIASMIYQIPQVASTEILIGGLATALGATVAYWMGRGRDDK